MCRSRTPERGGSSHPGPCEAGAVSRFALVFAEQWGDAPENYCLRLYLSGSDCVWQHFGIVIDGFTLVSLRKWILRAVRKRYPRIGTYQFGPIHEPISTTRTS